MKIAVIVNSSKKGSEETSREIQNQLSKYEGVDFFVSDGVEIHENINMIFVVGGDGTLLRTVSKAVELNVPIICFNTGKVGFLAEVSSVDGVENAIKRILEGDYEIENRSLLELTYYDQLYYALNDVSITKDEHTNVIKAFVQSQGKTITSFQADGILVSTPTGSTAYSLSAGGPIISPDVDAMLMTPVCAHVLFSRPMLFKGSDIIRIGAESKKSVLINVDGKKIAKFTGTDYFEVTTSQKTIKLIKLHDESFYTKLQKKLLQWTVENNN